MNYLQLVCQRKANSVVWFPTSPVSRKTLENPNNKSSSWCLDLGGTAFFTSFSAAVLLSFNLILDASFVFLQCLFIT